MFFKNFGYIATNKEECCIRSDRNTGLKESLLRVFPLALHVYCLFHLKINLRHHLCKKSSGLREHLVFLFSKCAYAPTMESFRKLLDQFIREEGPVVTEFLKDLPYTHWCNAYFRGQRYGEM